MATTVGKTGTVSNEPPVEPEVGVILVVRIGSALTDWVRGVMGSEKFVVLSLVLFVKLAPLVCFGPTDDIRGSVVLDDTLFAEVKTEIISSKPERMLQIFVFT